MQLALIEEGIAHLLHACITVVSQRRLYGMSVFGLSFSSASYVLSYDIRFFDVIHFDAIILIDVEVQRRVVSRNNLHSTAVPHN